MYHDLGRTYKKWVLASKSKESIVKLSKTKLNIIYIEKNTTISALSSENVSQSELLTGKDI